MSNQKENLVICSDCILQIVKLLLFSKTETNHRQHLLNSLMHAFIISAIYMQAYPTSHQTVPTTIIIHLDVVVKRADELSSWHIKFHINSPLLLYHSTVVGMFCMLSLDTIHTRGSVWTTKKVEKIKIVSGSFARLSIPVLNAVSWVILSNHWFWNHRERCWRSLSSRHETQATCI